MNLYKWGKAGLIHGEPFFADFIHVGLCRLFVLISESQPSDYFRSFILFSTDIFLLTFVTNASSVSISHNTKYRIKLAFP